MVAKIDLTLSFDTATGQFTWGGTHVSTANIAGIINVTEQIVVEITLAPSNLIFNSDTPIIFISNHDNFDVPSDSGGGNKLSFTVTQPPTSFFNPLALSFNVDAGSVQGINSPPLFMTHPADTTTSPPSATVSVQYSLDNGSFTLDEAGAPLVSEVLLINASPPPIDVTFNLSTNRTGSNVHFISAQGAIPTAWNPTVSEDGTLLTVTIPENANRFASFQFSITVGDVIVISPDPILVNATIGDGSGN